ncbi:trimethyllysine dioxygenase TmlH, putative [Talaromyces stipitatus ATCC 10500]|uniref:Trimethyllysine dioxygenase n=1 Tax=Talaromyces stipitatus (strain ATCC 10500 / CBS 375.48 / QM 6759 / NRRL 1006) TaxID=441959 RepID=B8M6P7_TALSN|nr:trimethyllysine dioxygenase TmlH, putative [Talaromyces stipitatus ATCC 10500]EED19509.1 trimethyllysine dioxygenase TmlH, putative [Talaromyces stipitatus ATCC 10500]
MTLLRVRPGNLCRAHELILKNFSSPAISIRPVSSSSPAWPWKQVPKHSMDSGVPSASDTQPPLDVLEMARQAQTDVSTGNGADGDIDTKIKHVLSSIPAHSNQALSTEVTSSDNEVQLESVSKSILDKSNLDVEGNVTDLSGSAIKKIKSSEDVSFYNYVHIRPFKYPAYWLRDNCQCTSCIRPDTRQRMVSSFSIPKNIHAKSVFQASPGQINVIWSDGHMGEYSMAWLDSHQMPSEVTHSNKVLTFRNFKHRRQAKSHPWVNYEEVMNTGQGLTLWLQKVVDWGYCLVKGVPVTPEATKQLLERIAFIRETHYGGFWDFTSDLTFKDTAYTTEALGAHTDNTYFSDPARLQLFHLLEHTEGEGGETLLVDGFYAAQRMLIEAPHNVEAFTDYAHPWHSSGNEHISIQPYVYFPVFERDPTTARLMRIRWNNYDRAAKIDWTPYMAMSWYSAARHWNAILLRKDQTQKWLQLEPGTAILFDNWRMLHGRSEFTGKRRMCGGYINNDDFLSRYRLLKNGRENTLNQIGTYKTRLSV